jgi:hypothetical protein
MYERVCPESPAAAACSGQGGGTESERAASIRFHAGEPGHGAAIAASCAAISSTAILVPGAASHLMRAG